MSEKITLVGRWMEKDDLFDVVECELTSQSYTDPDFDLQLINDWAWTDEDIEEALEDWDGEYPVRGMVCEIPVYDDDDEEVGSFLCGAIIYEIRPEGYDILLLTVHADAPEQARKFLLDRVLDRAKHSRKRKLVSTIVADGDYSTLKFYQDQGFAVKLIRNPTGSDGWRCELNTGEAKPPRRRGRDGGFRSIGR